MIERDGWRAIKQDGSHRRFRHPTKPGTVTVPMHYGRDLPPGTAHSISAGRDREEEPVSDPRKYAIVIEQAADGGYGA